MTEHEGETENGRKQEPELPPSESVAVNLNVRVAVTLTAKGREILRAHWEPYCRSSGNPADRVGEDGMYETQLWDLMNVFGPFIGMGFKLPFASTEIRLLPDPWASTMMRPERASVPAFDPSRSTTTNDTGPNTELSDATT